MVIHVVQPGDTLWAISRRYGVPMDSISQANGLDQIPYLVPGLALVIPTQATLYTVRPGDTLWRISSQFNVSVSSIVQANNIQNPDVLYVGMTLRIPASESYGRLEVNGYVELTNTNADAQIAADYAPYLTYVSPFSYQVKEDGTLTAPQDVPVLQAARTHNAVGLMVITNFRNGNFDAQLIHTILTNDTLQNTLIAQVLAVMKNKGYYGLNIDFERIPPEDRNLYNAFLRKVVAALHPQGYVVSTALAPKLSAGQAGEWYGAHDYQAHGEIVDFVILMTYEWGWSGGPPMAVAPINQVRKVVEYALSVMPANKIMMGVPLYGYDWTLPYQRGGQWARRVSPLGAVQLAARQGAYIKYDIESQSPFFNYTDAQGKAHVVWFEDARSVEAKYNLAHEYKLRGVSYWVLGQPFPQNWVVLDSLFDIAKLV